MITISVPHAGIIFPEGAPDYYHRGYIRVITDYYMDKMAWNAKEGLSNEIKDDINLVLQKYARFIDVNRRKCYGLDNKIVKSRGIIKTINPSGEKICSQVTIEKLESLLSMYYYPFHKRLRESVKKAYLLVDLHSAGPTLMKKAEVVIGTREGKSCSHDIVNAIESAFKDYKIVVDQKGLRGGHITNSYHEGRLQTVQIEVARTLYLEDYRMWMNMPNNIPQIRLQEFNKLGCCLTDCLENLFTYLKDKPYNHRCGQGSLHCQTTRA